MSNDNEIDVVLDEIDAIMDSNSEYERVEILKKILDELSQHFTDYGILWVLDTCGEWVDTWLDNPPKRVGRRTPTP